jgi:hypothetical protein
MDAIDELLRTAAARAELDALLAGKTDDEKRDVLIGVLCGAVAQLARQNDALAGLVQKSARVIELLERKVAGLERGVRGPYVRRVDTGPPE